MDHVFYVTCENWFMPKISVPDRGVQRDLADEEHYNSNAGNRSINDCDLNRLVFARSRPQQH
jgi:hypothetical protein